MFKDLVEFLGNKDKLRKSGKEYTGNGSDKNCKISHVMVTY